MIDEMKRQNRELVYKGSILDIYKDTMQFANGKTEEWDFVSHLSLIHIYLKRRRCA